MEYKLPILLFLLASVFIFALPIGNFPLEDDYAYYTMVKEFIQNGNITSHPASTATFILPIFYGALASKLLGLSHNTLALSTMLLSAFSIVAIYFFLRIWLSKKLSVAGALFTLFNPIFFYLGHTFMTDIPTFLFMMLSIGFFYKGVESKNSTYLFFGAVSSILGFLIRQYAVMPLAATVAYLIFTQRRSFFTLKNIMILIVLPAIFIVPAALLHASLHDFSACPYSFAVGPTAAKNLVQFLIHFGFFIFPFSLLYIANYKKIYADFSGLHKPLKIAVASIPIILVLFLFARYLYGIDIMPYATSMIKPNGVGADTISGIKPFLFPEAVWIPITILSFIAVTCFAVQFLKRALEKDKLFLIVMLVFLITSMFVYRHFYDRYYLISIPILLLYLFQASKDYKLFKPILILSLIIFGLWAYYGTYDHMSWNTARWEGINYLLQSGIPQEKIDGGMEYDARFFVRCVVPEGAVNWHGWAYSLSDEYVISFSKLDGYESLKDIDYFGPFKEKLGTIYVLKKV